jgi:16S rRNA (guanine527-N7)-methyltransferase
MGQNGEKVLEDTFKNWEFDFEKRKSITNEDSFLLNIKNIKKKTKN